MKEIQGLEATITIMPDELAAIMSFVFDMQNRDLSEEEHKTRS